MEIFPPVKISVQSSGFQCSKFGEQDSAVIDPIQTLNLER